MTEVKQPMELWVDRLRSGTIPQGTGRLALGTSATGIPEKMCCLGVACEVYREVTGNGEWDRIAGWHFCIGDTAVDTHLPKEVAEWLGINFDDPDAESPYVKVEFGSIPGGVDEKVPLIELNDTYTWDFDQIADAIERTYLT